MRGGETRGQREGPGYWLLRVTLWAGPEKTQDGDTRLHLTVKMGLHLAWVISALFRKIDQWANKIFSQNYIENPSIKLALLFVTTSTLLIVSLNRIPQPVCAVNCCSFLPTLRLRQRKHWRLWEETLLPTLSFSQVGNYCQRSTVATADLELYQISITHGARGSRK